MMTVQCDIYIQIIWIGAHVLWILFVCFTFQFRGPDVDEVIARLIHGRRLFLFIVNMFEFVLTSLAIGGFFFQLFCCHDLKLLNMYNKKAKVNSCDIS